jgi:DNA polymerase III epsilon subunit-like protein
VNKQFPWPPYIACSVQEYYHRFGYRPSLEKLYEFINKEHLDQTHRAMDDAEALAKILIADNFAEWYL